MIVNEFDKKVKEMMDGLGEVPPADLWDGISSSLVKRRRAVVIRRGFGSIAAVAAVIALFFVMGGDSIFKAKPELPALNASALQKEMPKVAPKEKIAVVEQTHTRIAKAVIEILLEEKTMPLEKSVDTDIQVSVKPNVSVASEEENEASVVNDINKDNQKDKIETREKKTLEMVEYEESINSKKNKLGKPLLSFSTILSPPLSSGSVELMSTANSGHNSIQSSMDREQVLTENMYDSKYLPPVSFGFQVVLPVDKRFSFGTGINYTLLYSYTLLQNRYGNERREQTVHYVGIPFNFYVNILESKNFRLYGSTGLTLEKGIIARYKILGDFPEDYTESVPGFQWSVSAGVGGEYLLHKNLGLYADPSLTYFFPGEQPVTVRTVEPLQFKLEVGFRLHF